MSVWEGRSLSKVNSFMAGYLRDGLNEEVVVCDRAIFFSDSVEEVFLGMFMAAARRVASFWKTGAHTLPPPG